MAAVGISFLGKPSAELLRTVQNAENDAALVELLKAALEDKDVFVFNKFLEMENVKRLENANNDQHKAIFRTLHLFANSTFKEYMRDPSPFLDLTSGLIKKLRYLTLARLASDSKSMPYSALLEELNIAEVLYLEKLIVDAIKAGIIYGKLDKENSKLEVDNTFLIEYQENEDSEAQIEEFLRELWEEHEKVDDIYAYWRNNRKHDP